MTVGRESGGGLAERRARTRLEERRVRRRRRAIGVVVGAAAAALVFLLGLSLGRALEQAPRPGGTETRVRTLQPGTLPATTRTVTVTDSGG